jgi:serine/threonine protein kinase
VEVPSQARVIAGRYELESLIGEGGMASVWRARDLTLERRVAVKLLFARDERDNQTLVKQFLREARIAASVHHRNVIQIVDFGTTEAQQPFMVMELLEGESLGQRLQREPKLTLAEIAHIASLTLRGLAAVHEGGIIHRDLKPDNIFLMHDSTGAYFPKILDFGISRSTEPRSGRRSALTTREGMIVGTPEYMSPEQARGVRGIDKRSDIYAVGAILYEAFTGRLPFISENVGDLIIQIVTGTLQPVHLCTPEVPQPLSDIVTKAMSRSPDDRYQDALEMQQALMTAAEFTLGTSIRRTLSDMPPLANELSPAPASPRMSQERLRTLEFALDIEEGAAPARPAERRPPVPPPPLPADAPEPARVTRRRRSLAMIGASVLAACVTAGVLVSRKSQDAQGAIGSETVTQLPISTPVIAKPAMIAPSAEPTTIIVQLNNVPKGAHIFVDDQPAGTPIELARDGRNRVIKVTAPGKSAWQAVHHASANAAFDVFMVPLESGKSAGSNAAQASKPSLSSREPTAARTASKMHKKPPSALRTLDF